MWKLSQKLVPATSSDQQRSPATHCEGALQKQEAIFWTFQCIMCRLPELKNTSLKIDLLSTKCNIQPTLSCNDHCIRLYGDSLLVANCVCPF